VFLKYEIYFQYLLCFFKNKFYSANFPDFFRPDIHPIAFNTLESVGNFLCNYQNIRLTLYSQDTDKQLALKKLLPVHPVSMFFLHRRLLIISLTKMSRLIVWNTNMPLCFCPHQYSVPAYISIADSNSLFILEFHHTKYILC